jgi:hypothetical protein
MAVKRVFETLEAIARRAEGGLTPFGRREQLQTPYYDYVTLRAGAQAIHLNAVQVDVDLEKDLVITPLYGRGESGAIVEEMRTMPRALVIRGWLFAQKGNQPRQLRRQLDSLCGSNSALEVESPSLLDYNIHSIVIRRLSLPAQQHLNAQPFSIYAYADQYAELELRGNV